MPAHLKLFVGRELCDTTHTHGEEEANADSVTRLFSAPAPAPYIYSPMLILHSLPNTPVQYYSLKVFLQYY